MIAKPTLAVPARGLGHKGRRVLYLWLMLWQSTVIGQQTLPVLDPPTDLQHLSLEDIMRIKVGSVTTASKKEEKTTEAPGTAIVIDQKDIKLRGYSTMVDVLRDLPGMDLSEFIFSELGTQVSVRGIPSNNKIVVLVNGMRVNPPGGEYFPLRSDFSVRHAEQIEVIYGPGSTLYGQDAISAVINVKTKNPPADGRTLVEGGMEGGLHGEHELWGSFGKVFDADRNIALSGFIQYHQSDLSNVDRDYPEWWGDFRKVAETKGRGTVPDRTDYGLNAFAKLEWGISPCRPGIGTPSAAVRKAMGRPFWAFCPKPVGGTGVGSPRPSTTGTSRTR